MTQTITIHQQRIKLDPADLIQSGGEGLVFRVADTAVKLYHQPTAQHQAKLNYLFQTGLVARLPTAVLAPCAPVMDDQGEVIGFQMPLLPPHSQPIKRLANPIFRQKQHIPSDDVLGLLRQIHTTLAQLHQTGVIIGDLNDTNLFFTPSPPHPHDASSPTLSLIDADSYQFAHFPCPVAMPAFLDPMLYDVADFGARPTFTPPSDWYAFTVLLVKSLLGVHPFGGTHPQLKSLQARAQAGVSILDTAVTYPPNALPLDTLSDDLRHYLQRVFERGERPIFPADLLSRTLRHQGAIISRLAPAKCISAPHVQRELLHTDGFIEHLALLPNGRLQAVIYEGNSYKLVQLGIGGKVDEMALFDGRAGYRFGLFDHYVVVNPPGGRQLLILDVHGRQPQKVTMIETMGFQETAVFADTAVFATTPQHLYRIAGNWIMRGTVQNGHYVEDTIATAHRQQTQLWASPYNDTIAGSHRIFAEQRFFVQTAVGSYDLAIPPLAAGETIAETGVAFGRDTVAVVLRVVGHGRQRTDTHLFSLTGKLVNSWSEADDVWEKVMNSYPINPVPPDISPHARLYQHPAGLIIQEPSRLFVVGDSSPF